jgi:hypothetical protein
MAQFARPSADTTVGSWTANGGPSNLYECLDEVTASDTDYIDGGSSSTENRIELATVTDPVSSAGHVLRVRWQAYGSGGPERISLDLYEGTTLIVAAFDNYAPGRAWADDSYTLSAGEANSISDYSDLNVRFTVDAADGSEGIQVSWCELEVPDSVIQLAATIAGVTTTPDTASVAIARQLAATVSWANSTPDTASVAIARQLTATISWTSSTPDTATLSIAEAGAEAIIGIFRPGLVMLTFPRPIGRSLWQYKDN